MNQDHRIYAVTVNQNTSHFVELMARILFFTNALQGLDVRLVVLDNSSTDPHSADLKSYLVERALPLVQTGLDTTATVAVEKHGVALEQFVLDHPDCSYYLFLDADKWFFEPETISTMVNELRSAPADVFANQARIIGYYAGGVIEGQEGRAGANGLEGKTWETWVGEKTYTTRIAPRCSPVCALIANTPVFRTVVSGVGLTPALRFGVQEAVHHDTFSLMTAVMATHGYRFIVSARQVNHFTETTYAPDWRAPKDHHCLQMLADLRNGRGMGADYFRESEWTKKQRRE